MKNDNEDENLHYHPISVSEAPGSTYAVRVEETFNDGSTRVQHYTKEQAKELLNGLQNVLNEEDN